MRCHYLILVSSNNWQKAENYFMLQIQIHTENWCNLINNQGVQHGKRISKHVQIIYEFLYCNKTINMTFKQSFCFEIILRFWMIKFTSIQNDQHPSGILFSTFVAHF